MFSKQNLKEVVSSLKILLQDIIISNDSSLNINKIEEVNNKLTLADYTLSKIISNFPKQYINDLSNVNITSFSKEEIAVISNISLSNKEIKKKEKSRTLAK